MNTTKPATDDTQVIPAAQPVQPVYDEYAAMRMAHMRPQRDMPERAARSLFWRLFGIVLLVLAWLNAGLAGVVGGSLMMDRSWKGFGLGLLALAAWWSLRRLGKFARGWI